MNYFLIDDCKRTASAAFETKINAKNDVDAIETARWEWEHMSKADRSRRDDYYLVRTINDDSPYTDDAYVIWQACKD